jgi:hypothetical protein
MGIAPYDLREAFELSLGDEFEVYDRALTDPARIEFHSPKPEEGSPCTCKPKHGWRHYTVHGEVVASVSQIVGVVDKSGPLQGYAARVTREGVVKLLQARKFRIRDESLEDAQRRLDRTLYALGFHYKQQTSDAQDRGTAIHKMGEDWVDFGKIPNPQDVKPEWRGWARALAKFLRECQPEFHESEIMVGSARYGFAGRRDTVATCVAGKGKLTRDGRGLIDYKTSKGIYPKSQYVQIAGYDLGGIECGHEPTDWQAIVQLGEDGSYSVGYSTATHDDFLAYLAAFNACRGVEARAKAAA